MTFIDDAFEKRSCAAAEKLAGGVNEVFQVGLSRGESRSPPPPPLQLNSPFLPWLAAQKLEFLPEIRR